MNHTDTHTYRTNPEMLAELKATNFSDIKIQQAVAALTLADPESIHTLWRIYCSPVSEGA